MAFNPYTATGDPAALREQAKQARQEAKERRDEAWKALRTGNSTELWALNRQASELDSLANKLESTARNVESERANSDALHDGGKALGTFNSDLPLQGLIDGTKPDVPGLDRLYRDGFPRSLGMGQDATEKALDNMEVWEGTPGAIGKAIEGRMRKQINDLLDNSHNLPPAPTGGASSAPPAHSGRDSWRGATLNEDADGAGYERTVDDAVQDLLETARQQREQRKVKELLDILKTPAPAPTAPPSRRERFDQPTPSPSVSPAPKRYRFDQNPTPTLGGESLDLRNRRSRFD